MTYSVSSGTLNSTIPYHIGRASFIADERVVLAGEIIFDAMSKGSVHNIRKISAVLIEGLVTIGQLQDVRQNFQIHHFFVFMVLICCCYYFKRAVLF